MTGDPEAATCEECGATTRDVDSPPGRVLCPPCKVIVLQGMLWRATNVAVSLEGEWSELDRVIRDLHMPASYRVLWACTGRDPDGCDHTHCEWVDREFCTHCLALMQRNNNPRTWVVLTVEAYSDALYPCDTIRVMEEVGE